MRCTARKMGGLHGKGNVMSESPERIWAWQYNDHETGGKHDCGEWYIEDVGLDGDEVEYRRANLPPTDEECLLNAKVRALVDAAQKFQHAVCDDTGFAFCVRADSGKAYPWPALDIADELVRAAIAAMQEVEDDN